MKIAEIRIEVGNTMCKLGTSEWKRGRRCNDNVERMLKVNMKKSSAVKIPTSSIRQDSIGRWPDLLETKQRCEYPLCKGFTTVWFKNRRAKCRQQQKQHQQSTIDSTSSKHNRSNGSGSIATNSTKASTKNAVVVVKPDTSVHNNNIRSDCSSTTSQSTGPLLRESPNYVKPQTQLHTVRGSTSTPPGLSGAHSSQSSNTSIWSPAVTDPCASESRAAGTWFTSGSNQTNYQSYGGFYSNIEYLGPAASAMHQLVGDNSLESSWAKTRDDASWFYNSTSWERK